MFRLYICTTRSAGRRFKPVIESFHYFHISRPASSAAKGKDISKARSKIGPASETSTVTSKKVSKTVRKAAGQPTSSTSPTPSSKAKARKQSVSKKKAALKLDDVSPDLNKAGGSNVAAEPHKKPKLGRPRKKKVEEDANSTDPSPVAKKSKPKGKKATPSGLFGNKLSQTLVDDPWQDIDRYLYVGYGGARRRRPLGDHRRMHVINESLCGMKQASSILRPTTNSSRRCFRAPRAFADSTHWL